MNFQSGWDSVVVAGSGIVRKKLKILEIRFMI